MKMTLELLNIEKISMAIESSNASRLSALHIFDTIDSTNSYLLEKARLNAASGLVCLAEQQTKGRGRLGREWYSPYAVNIYCSILWRFPRLSQDISGLSIAVAVMVASALRKYGISAEIQLKWPNDVWVANRKLAGILLERNDKTGVVIGIGLNLDVADANEKKWIDVAELMGRPVKRNFLVGLLLNELLEKLPVYASQGISAFLPEWKKHDVLCDKEVSVQTPEKCVSGTMRGISEQGELLLEDATGGLLRFSYGEVSVKT
jgi:BirA family biotin operon repressor/biotin-[acetyl-CoA-carboxylase] ligase